jgi:hypothetical protein
MELIDNHCEYSEPKDSHSRGRVGSMSQSFNIEEYMKKFRVFDKQVTLFPPDFKNLQKNKCPICGRKLYITADKKKAFCKSKLKDRFFITTQRLCELGGSIYGTK